MVLEFRLDDPTPADPRRRWDTLAQEARDACYDNTRAVADSASQVAARDAASAAYRAAHPAGLDVPYGPGARNALDLYPARDAAAPCLVFVHGGYWQRGARELFACFAQGPNAAGWSVAMVGYTLAPEASLARLRGLDLLIIDALRDTPHPTHFSVSDALALIRAVRPRRAVLTNLHTDLDYAALAARLPEGIVPAYDGMSLSLDG